jgi:hypothetical protein
MKLILSVASIALVASFADAFLPGRLPGFRSQIAQNVGKCRASNIFRPALQGKPFSIRMEGMSGTEIKPVIANEGKKSHTTDVVVIGAGLGGLCAGALLVRL